MHINDFCKIGKALNDNNIPFTILKGLAVITYYNDDLGTRMMNDIDLLVDKNDYSNPHLPYTPLLSQDQKDP